MSNTAQLFCLTASCFTARLPTFLFLSLLLFSFRTTVEYGTSQLISFVDQDPSLKALVSRRLQLAGTDSERHPIFPRLAPRRRPSYLVHPDALVMAFNDYFFPGDDQRMAPLNHSLLILNQELVFPKYVIVNISAMKELELRESEDKRMVFFARSVMWVYILVVLWFVAIYSLGLGIVFITVVNEILGTFNSFLVTMWEGSRVGLERLFGLILMRWLVRHILTYLLGWWYFGKIEDQDTYLKLYVMLKLMPFSIMSPWISGLEKEILGFSITCFLTDTFLALIFAGDVWIAIMEPWRTQTEIMQEGYYLTLTTLSQGIHIISLEAIFCGPFVRVVLAQVFGRFFAMVFQSVLEVYFMVALLMLYFYAWYRNSSNFHGETFGWRELEGLFDL
ncbi:hypothetical protein F2P56_007606 [Juglans regia]|uniref:Uncharacterized protein LOC109018216 n=2 Tax=Juglans regia TaxID=51240 RepID=A0A2I4HID5_JUGRE|nr:uncharacterized protein LOC109018216 [Juglans regia]KAF5475842.1 hypothetical protein F2P56_007606 [Juglans regia]